MIDIAEVLRDVPSFETFCSVEKLHGLVEMLRADSRFKIDVAGRSEKGLPIHHVQFGEGSVKAMFVAFPHCDEPIGGLTVFSLLTLLNNRNSGVLNADVEWHIVPCIDPDGAILNEGWSQKEFTLGNYMRNFHKQHLRDQAECSFPIEYKKLVFNKPTKEAKILQTLLTEVRPDFYYTLHNANAGGAYFFLTRDIGQKYYRQFHNILDQYRIPLQVSAPHSTYCAQFAEGIYEMATVRNLYDLLEKSTPSPEEALRMGACSWEHLAEIKEDAMSFATELPYVKHPNDGSKKATTQNLRQLKLRADVDNKYVATVILEEWENVKGDLDSASPFYKKVAGAMASAKDQLHEELPFSGYKTRDLLFNPAYGGMATEGDQLNVYLIDRLYVLCNSYEFVRLLKTSAQTLAVKRAIARLDPIFDEALDDIEEHIDLNKLEIVDCDTLAKVQLGTGLVVLNSLLERRSKAA